LERLLSNTNKVRSTKYKTQTVGECRKDYITNPSHVESDNSSGVNIVLNCLFNTCHPKTRSLVLFELGPCCATRVCLKVQHPVQ